VALGVEAVDLAVLAAGHSAAGARAAVGDDSAALEERFRMEAKLKELIERLKAVAADNLKTVVLYGSAVTVEFSARHSDLNVLCLVDRAGAAELESLHGVAEWWTRAGNPAPLVFTLDELHRSADVFAIELLDMKLRHRVLLGDDFLAAFDVPLVFHRVQVERELRTDWLRLRQAILAAPQKRKDHLGIMLASVSTFCALFRHALFGLGQPMPETKRQAVEALALLTGADPSAFHAILDLREGKRKESQLDIEATLHTYLEFVEIVTNEVDRRLEAQ
jgi:predicted nucleotidyltransferase